jgi:hypothetical protein
LTPKRRERWVPSKKSPKEKAATAARQKGRKDQDSTAKRLEEPRRKLVPGK